MRLLHRPLITWDLLKNQAGGFACGSATDLSGNLTPPSSGLWKIFNKLLKQLDFFSAVFLARLLLKNKYKPYACRRSAGSIESDDSHSASNGQRPSFPSPGLNAEVSRNLR